MLTIDAPLAAAIGTISGTFKVFVDSVANSADAKYWLVPLGLLYAVLLAAYLVDTSPGRARLTAWVGGACGFVFAAIAFSGILTNLIKVPIGRARPYIADHLAWPEFDPFAASGDFHSFPSGHANTAFALAIAAGFFVPPLRRYFLIFAIGVAFGRVLQIRHYLSDSIGGALLAIASTYWLRMVFARYGVVFRRRQDGSITLSASGRLLRRIIKRRFQSAATVGAPKSVSQAEAPGTLQ